MKKLEEGRGSSGAGEVEGKGVGNVSHDDTAVAGSWEGALRTVGGQILL
jgi:hypothetical protein